MTSKSNIEFPDSLEDRCPVVLLLDTSGSMVGKKIDELNNGLAVLKKELMKDNLARVRVEIAIITFGRNGVKMPQDFITADQWIPQRYEIGDITPMGEAINYALDSLDDRKESYKDNDIRYYRPWTFLITDGDPTDENIVWNNAVQRMTNAFQNKKIQPFSVGVQGANMNKLKEITPDPQFPPVLLKGVDFASMFKWLSDSLTVVSHSQLGGQQVNVTQPTWGQIYT